MDPLSIRIVRTALRTALAYAVLLAPLHVRASEGPSDCHEIPQFVLDRTAIVTGVD